MVSPRAFPTMRAALPFLSRLPPASFAATGFSRPAVPFLTNPTPPPAPRCLSLPACALHPACAAGESPYFFLLLRAERLSTRLSNARRAPLPTWLCPPLRPLRLCALGPAAPIVDKQDAPVSTLSAVLRSAAWGFDREELSQALLAGGFFCKVRSARCCPPGSLNLTQQIGEAVFA